MLAISSINAFAQIEGEPIESTKFSYYKYAPVEYDYVTFAGYEDDAEETVISANNTKSITILYGTIISIVYQDRKGLVSSTYELTGPITENTYKTGTSTHTFTAINVETKKQINVLTFNDMFMIYDAYGMLMFRRYK